MYCFIFYFFCGINKCCCCCCCCWKGTGNEVTARSAFSSLFSLDLTQFYATCDPVQWIPSWKIYFNNFILLQGLITAKAPIFQKANGGNSETRKSFSCTSFPSVIEFWKSLPSLKVIQNHFITLRRFFVMFGNLFEDFQKILRGIYVTTQRWKGLAESSLWFLYFQY